MSSKPVWVKWYPKDALDGMQTLGPWEELAYRRILDLIYATGDELPDDDRKLAWMTKTGRRWPAIKADLIADGKIEVVDGRITNARCQETLADCDRFFAQKGVAGKASAEKRKSRKTKKTDATVVDTHVSTRVPTNQKADIRESYQDESAAASIPVEARDNAAAVADHDQGATESDAVSLSPGAVRRIAPSPADAASAPGAVQEARAVGRKVLEIMGVWDDPRWYGNHARVEAWLRSGADPEADIYPTIERVMAQRDGRPPNSLKYFDPAIAEAVAARTRPMPEPAGVPHEQCQTHRDNRAAREGGGSTDARRRPLAAAVARRLVPG